MINAHPRLLGAARKFPRIVASRDTRPVKTPSKSKFGGKNDAYMETRVRLICILDGPDLIRYMVYAHAKRARATVGYLFSFFFRLHVSWAVCKRSERSQSRWREEIKIPALRFRRKAVPEYLRMLFGFLHERPSSAHYCRSFTFGLFRAGARLFFQRTKIRRWTLYRVGFDVSVIIRYLFPMLW